MFNKRPSPRVVIAGAGPTGLFGALCLLDAGVNIEILSPTERDPALRRRSSSAAVVLLHPGSLALLHRHGAAVAVIARGRRVRAIRVYRGRQCAGEVSFEQLSRGSGLPFDFGVCLARADLVECLREALRTRGAEVHDQRRLVRFEQGSARVRVTIDHLASDSAGYAIAHSELVVDKSEELEPEFVLAADGPHSVVRQQLSLPLAEQRPSESYLTVEGRATSPAPDAGALGFDAGATSAMWPLADGRQHGIFITRAEDIEMLGLSGAAALSALGGHARVEAKRLSAWVALRTPWLASAMTELEARGPFHAHHRWVSSFGRGRIWLAGAAAHSVSPLSSLSTNVGLSDAAQLAEIFAGALRGATPLEALEAYDAGQRERWQHLLEPVAKELDAAVATPPTPVGERRHRFGSATPAPGLDTLLAWLTSDPWRSLLQFGTTVTD
jgi:2-polyprenyl-6-methoxyphenol hydroxylase-like FAD-dependent oxidoreductase